MNAPAFGFGATPIFQARRPSAPQTCPVAVAGGPPPPGTKKKTGGAVGALRALFRLKPQPLELAAPLPGPAELPLPETSQAPAPVPTPAPQSAKPFAPPSAMPSAVPIRAPPVPRDARRIMVVGANGRLGREVVRALGAADTRFSVVGVVRSLSGETEGCGKVIVLDVGAQAEFLAAEVEKLGVGVVVWCATAGIGGAPPREIEFEAVDRLVKQLGGGRVPEEGGGWLGGGDLPLVRGAAAFRALNDVIMGGKSSSGVVEGGEGGMVWSGDVIVSGGGFASVRAELKKNEFTPGLDLSGCEGIAITCKGDGKSYKVNLKNAGDPEFVFQAPFETPASGKWTTVRVPFADFIPVKRGKIAYADNGVGIYAAELDVADVLSVGLVYSKVSIGGGLCPKFREGPFRLDIARIDAYRAATPRFVYVSSAAVTRPFWSEKKKALYSYCANIPIIKLNPGNVLGAKLAGEDSVRASSIPYTIVRPTALASDLEKGQRVKYFKGDFEVGRINPADVAETIVHALGCEEASFKTVEIRADPGAGGWNAKAATDSLRALPVDDELILFPGRVDEL